MKTEKDIRVHQIWLGLQLWEKFLAVLLPVFIGTGTGIGSGAFFIGQFKQKIEMTLTKQDGSIQEIGNRVDKVETELRSKVDYTEFYETKKKADESREALIEMKANLTFIKNTTDRTLTEIEKLRDRR